jgi:hypothetical protein
LGTRMYTMTSCTNSQVGSWSKIALPSRFPQSPRYYAGFFILFQGLIFLSLLKSLLRLILLVPMDGLKLSEEVVITLQLRQNGRHFHLMKCKKNLNNSL